jgi:predicted RNA-binding protein YlqC (UPF0109 family)
MQMSGIVENTIEYKELLEHIVTKLVEKPEVVTIGIIDTSDKSIIEIRVSAHDIARVIGKEGRTFKALRMLVQVVDPHAYKDVVVDIVQ